DQPVGVWQFPRQVRSQNSRFVRKRVLAAKGGKLICRVRWIECDNEQIGFRIQNQIRWKGEVCSAPQLPRLFGKGNGFVRAVENLDVLALGVVPVRAIDK